MVGNDAFSHKIDHFTIVWEILNLKGPPNCIKGCSQIMSAAKGGRGRCKMLTMADKGGRGGKANAVIG